MPAKKNKRDKIVKSLTPTIPDTIFLNCSFFLFSGTSLPSKQEASKACKKKRKKAWGTYWKAGENPAWKETNFSHAFEFACEIGVKTIRKLYLDLTFTST